jgi:hypothetical protein
LPAYDAELVYAVRPFGCITSAVCDNGRIVALAFVHPEVPEDAKLDVDGKPAAASAVV